MTPKFKRLALLAVLVLSGCGQKGPLFIPDKAPTNQQEIEDKDNKDTEKEAAKKDG